MTKNIIIFSLTVILLLSFCSLRSQTLALLTLTPDGNVKSLVSKSDTLIVAGDFNVSIPAIGKT